MGNATASGSMPHAHHLAQQPMVATGVSSMGSASASSIGGTSSAVATAPFDAAHSVVKPQQPVVTARKLDDLLKQIDPTERLDPDVHEVLAHAMDSGINTVAVEASNALVW
jgi:hypothetical protein